MKNFGKISKAWLAELGIYTSEHLKQYGSVHIYRLVRARHPKKASLNLLWALEGAIQGIDWRDLTEQRKIELKAEVLDLQ